MKFTTLNFLILSIFVLFSCNSGDDLEKEIDDKKELDEKDDEWDIDKEACFDFVYPITYIMPDETTISGDEETVDAAIKEWYESHDSDEKPTLNYPIQIAYFDNDVPQTIDNEEGLELAWKDCFDEDGEIDELEVCDWDGSLVANADAWTEHVIEDLVIKDDCGECVVDGAIKYVHASENTAYIIYYGKGECDNWGFLVSYENLNTDEKTVTKCKFEMDCN